MAFFLMFFVLILPTDYVNEQSEVTRCGMQDCGWGPKTTTSVMDVCAGVYKFPWFMTFRDASKLWTVPSTTS